ncbi:MAG TPA: LpxA family transferase [Burkholderiaceae bacterium]|nr:LpxA family transferase [Burkholderiaceae bacterium]
MSLVALSDYIATFAASPLAGWTDAEPWQLTARADAVVRGLLSSLDAEYVVSDEVAIHRSAVVESGAVLKGPLVVGPRAFVATGAYLRGGNWLAEGCTVGPACELKSSFVCAGSKLAHLNFVGDSIVGSRVNLEAGSIICNFRNERDDNEILVRIGASIHRTGCTKFGALVGGDCRIGANAVIAPGALLPAGTVVPRTALLDQDAT